jgi:hypothetical protein
MKKSTSPNVQSNLIFRFGHFPFYVSKQVRFKTPYQSKSWLSSQKNNILLTWRIATMVWSSTRFIMLLFLEKRLSSVNVWPAYSTCAQSEAFSPPISILPLLFVIITFDWVIQYFRCGKILKSKSSVKINHAASQRWEIKQFHSRSGPGTVCGSASLSLEKTLR